MSEKFILLDDNATWKGKAHFQCKTCGHVVYKSTQFVKHKHNLKCDNCFAIAKAEKEKLHKIEIEHKKQERRKLTELNKQLKSEEKNKPKIFVCADCGCEFYSIRKKKYCSDKCRRHSKNSRNKHDDIHKDRSIKYNTCYDSSIDLKKLIERDNGVCALCGEQVDLQDCYWYHNVFYVGNKYPSIDHIIPMSKGGAHVWDNIQLAHFYCNSVRGNAPCVAE